MDPGDEIFDVVDADDHVIGRASRREVHARRWMHRAVHILVFNSRGELFLQKRSPDKDENPGLWDTSAAGHVDSGEDYAQCAPRELEEELGLTDCSLEEILQIPAQPDSLWEHLRVYRCTTDTTIKINPLEISEGRFWVMKDLRDAMRSAPGQFTSSFHLILKQFINSC
ncbi:NUDIX hydrolase [Candidatus Nitromaritima sp. SCGC AAA799-A02]|nr:NUDIX hydrolase [Candidatus Nitromaritima sp. SCGC AAA799-A02]